MGDWLSEQCEYREFSLDSLDSTNSYTQGASTTDWPLFKTTLPIENVIGLKILEAQIPFSWDVYNEENNTFILVEAGISYTITIPTGNYNSPALASALTEAFLAAAPPSTYTVDYWSLRDRFIFTSSTTTTFNLVFGTSSDSGNTNPRLYIGFPAGTTTSALVGGFQAITSPNVIQVSGPNYLYVNSVSIGSDVDVFLPSGAKNLGGGVSGSQVAVIPVNCNPSGIITWTDPDPMKFFKYDQMQSMNGFDFFLTLGNTTTQYPLQLNGLGFKLKLGLLIETKTNVDRVLATAQNGRVTRREGPKRLRPTY